MRKLTKEEAREVLIELQDEDTETAFNVLTELIQKYTEQNEEEPTIGVYTEESLKSTITHISLHLPEMKAKKQEQGDDYQIIKKEYKALKATRKLCKFLLKYPQHQKICNDLAINFTKLKTQIGEHTISNIYEITDEQLSFNRLCWICDYDGNSPEFQFGQTQGDHIKWINICSQIEWKNRELYVGSVLIK